MCRSAPAQREEEKPRLGVRLLEVEDAGFFSGFAHTSQPLARTPSVRGDGDGGGSPSER